MGDLELIEAVLRPSPASKMPETIAHYTGLEGLRCILASNQIWASNVLFLNDSQEMTYGINEAVKFLTEQSQVVQDPGYRKVFTNIKKAISGEIPDAFACCFCENADMLGQWRGYGGVGQNVSIEFDTRQLERLLMNQNGRIVKVIYGRDETRRMLQERFDHNKTSLAWGRDLFKSEIDQKQESWTNLVLNLTPQFKHKSFEDEREWRVIVQKPSDGENVVFRTRDNVVIPYLKLGQVTVALPVVAIWIGPGRDLKLTKRSVENFLKSFDAYKNVPVKESNVPFRA